MINYCHFGSISKKSVLTLAIDCGGLLLQREEDTKSINMSYTGRYLNMAITIGINGLDVLEELHSALPSISRKNLNLWDQCEKRRSGLYDLYDPLRFDLWTFPGKSGNMRMELL